MPEQHPLDKLQAYREGTLSFLERLRVAEHLSHCESCSGEVALSERLNAGVLALHTALFPEEFEDESAFLWAEHLTGEQIDQFLQQDPTLPSGQYNAIQQHLDDCDDCYDLVEEALRFQKELTSEARRYTIPIVLDDVVREEPNWIAGMAQTVRKGWRFVAGSFLLPEGIDGAGGLAMARGGRNVKSPGALVLEEEQDGIRCQVRWQLRPERALFLSATLTNPALVGIELSFYLTAGKGDAARTAQCEHRFETVDKEFTTFLTPEGAPMGADVPIQLEVKERDESSGS